jgi:glycosyltransferase involved in cell wall biosynthesis
MQISIAGTRGIPASHGGFETFAQDLALFLVEKGHDVTVYCQSELGTPMREDVWQGVRRVMIPAGQGPWGTIWFDWATVRHVMQRSGMVLTLGFNTGVFSYLYRLRGRASAMNMDGIEWKREKWSRAQRAWLWLNERAGAQASTCLIADHPEIARHLKTHSPPEKIETIPYGADEVTSAPVELIQQYGLEPGAYYLVIARPEPENSLLEIVRGYSESRSALPLVVLGTYAPKSYPYHRRVIEAAGPGVKFLGAIYDRAIVQSLRFHAKAYIHGHRAGGTNPSLVESLAAGNAVIAHDNRFTRWVAGEGARYFNSAENLASILSTLDSDPELLAPMKQASRARYREDFTQEKVLSQYERLLTKLNAASVTANNAAEPSPGLK